MKIMDIFKIGTRKKVVFIISSVIAIVFITMYIIHIKRMAGSENIKEIQQVSKINSTTKIENSTGKIEKSDSSAITKQSGTLDHSHSEHTEESNKSYSTTKFNNNERNIQQNDGAEQGGNYSDGSSGQRDENSQIGQPLSDVNNIKGNDNRGNYTSETGDLQYGRIYISRNQQDNIEIYNLLQDGRLLLTTFTKKEWGTYNIESQYLCHDKKIPSQNKELMLGGGSDWEYVIAAGETKSKLFFSGGNHGNEVMTSLEFFDDTGEQIEILKNQIRNISNITIRESTQLSIPDSGEGGYCNVERLYYFEPSKITFTSNFTFTRDVFLGNTYVCMMPSTKKYGNHILFKDAQKEYTTPSEGQTLTTDTYSNNYGILPTLSAEIWGDWAPDIHFTASIKDSEMVDYFTNSLKVFYWDVNIYGNKLYYSKYDTASPTLVSARTAWNNRAVWQVDIK